MRSGLGTALTDSLNSKLSFTDLEENDSSTGDNSCASPFSTIYWGAPVMESTGGNGTCCFCTFGRPYILGRTEPTGLTLSNFSAVIYPYLHNFVRNECNLLSTASVLLNCEHGPNLANFDVSHTMTSISFKYLLLDITTTASPLSGLVIISSARQPFTFCFRMQGETNFLVAAYAPGRHVKYRIVFWNQFLLLDRPTTSSVNFQRHVLKVELSPKIKCG